jgi:2'-5' RNA ligase
VRDPRAEPISSAIAVSAPARIRSFVALDLEPPVRDTLRRLQAALEQVGADVRWVRPGGMHLTLKFLGAVEPRRLERVRRALQAIAGRHAALQLRVRGLGAFPSWRRPRVVWAGLEGAGLVALAADVEGALAGIGFVAEPRPFTPHVTLGRVQSLRGWPHLQAVLAAHREDDCGTTVVDAIVIYQSTLRPGGAVYAPLWTIPLGGNKKEANS